MNLATKESIIMFILCLSLIIFFGFAIHEDTVAKINCDKLDQVKEYVKECSYKQDIDTCKYNARDLFCGPRGKAKAKLKAEAE